jgi:hypothetical protein
MSMPRQIVAALVGAGLFFTSASIRCESGHASEIAVFEFAGDHESFKILVRMLRTRVENLRPSNARWLLRSGPEKQQLTSLVINADRSDEPRSIEQTREFMAAVGDILCTVQGAILPSGNSNAFIAESSVVLPDGVSPVDSPIRIKMDIREYANNRDRFAIMILYLLAKEAKKGNLSSSYVVDLSSAANEAWNDIRRRNGGQVNDSQMSGIIADFKQIAPEIKP